MKRRPVPAAVGALIGGIAAGGWLLPTPALGLATRQLRAASRDERGLKYSESWSASKR